MPERFYTRTPVVRLVIIHPDLEQILVDQGASVISLPRLDLPVPAVVPDQPILERLTGLITRMTDIDGTVVALSPGSHGKSDRGLLAVFAASDVGVVADLDRRNLRWREITSLQALSDEDTSARIREALNLVKARRLTSDLQGMWPGKLHRAVIFLRERMVEKDGLAGWTQFLSGDSVGVVSTAQGALAFLEAGEADQGTTRNIDAIKVSQNEDGGWPVRRALIGHSDLSITESTVYCLWALTRSGIDAQDPQVVRGVEWLERARLGDGGWGSTSSATRARTYPTAFACRYLAAISGSSTVVREAVNWLRSAQTASGGWAPLSRDETSTSQSATPLHTAHALLALLAAGVDAGDAQVASAIRYLKTSMTAAQGEPWPSTSEVEEVDQDAALDFRHFTTPWVLCALLEGGVAIGDPVVANAIQWLINAQHSLGYWSCSLAPGQTPVWATFDAIFALSRVRRTAIDQFSELVYSGARAVELNYAWSSYFSALDDFEQQAASHRFRRSRWLYVWNSVLTFAVALLLVFRGTNIGLNLSPATKIIGSALIGLVPGFAPFLYQFFLEEFKFRHRKIKDG